MSDWLEVMREACKHPSSQSKVAEALNVSPAMINQALKGVYKGNLNRLEKLFRGTYMKETVMCPVLGTITQRQCLDEQARPFASTNPQRVSLFKSCRNGCGNKAK